jgi:hypothetical protein
MMNDPLKTGRLYKVIDLSVIQAPPLVKLIQPVVKEFLKIENEFDVSEAESINKRFNALYNMLIYKKIKETFSTPMVYVFFIVLYLNCLNSGNLIYIFDYCNYCHLI